MPHTMNTKLLLFITCKPWRKCCKTLFLYIRQWTICHFWLLKFRPMNDIAPAQCTSRTISKEPFRSHFFVYWRHQLVDDQTFFETSYFKNVECRDDFLFKNYRFRWVSTSELMISRRIRSPATQDPRKSQTMRICEKLSSSLCRLILLRLDIASR